METKLNIAEILKNLLTQVLGEVNEYMSLKK